MKTQRLALVLTVINFIILIFNLAPIHQAVAEDVAPVLRGRALEIVDASGKIRAQIIVTSDTTMADGKRYPETSLLRLIDPNGRPGVKIATSVDGSGMTLTGDSERQDWSGIQMLANAGGSSISLTNRDGSKHLVTP